MKEQLCRNRHRTLEVKFIYELLNSIELSSKMRMRFWWKHGS